MAEAPGDRAPFEPAALLRGLQHTAAVLGAPFDGRAVHKVLSAFDEEFRHCVVQLKTTSAPAHGLNFRFFSTALVDLVARADRERLRSARPERLEHFQKQLSECLPDATQAGLDFDCGIGLAKLWTSLRRRPVDELVELPFMPSSVPRHRAFFADHGLGDCFFLAADYHNETINIYTFLEPASRSREWLEEILRHTGCALPASVDARAVVHALRAGACVGATFGWDRPTMHRWALYGLNVPYLDPAESRGLPPLPDRLRTFVDISPTLSREPHLNVAWQFEPARCVVKLEKSYAHALPASAALKDPLFVELAGRPVTPDDGPRA
jgi:hypothetical protein